MSQRLKHLRWLHEELPHWERHGWISAEGAEQVRAHYGPVAERDYRQAAMAAFAALAALLIGGGIVLVFAHNWEALSRPVRAVLSVLPLIITQALGCFTLARRNGSTAWREGVAVANACALAAGIGLVGQTYNIPGNLSGFLLVLSLLSLPVAYLMRSRWTVLLYLGAIVWWRWLSDAGMAFWLLWALALPAVLLWREGAGRSPLLGTVLVIASAIGLPVDEGDLWWGLAAAALYGSAIIGWSADWRTIAAIGRTPRCLALPGMAIVLLIGSYGDAWREEGFYDGPLWQASVILAILAILSATGLVIAGRKHDWTAAAWAAAGVMLLLLRLSCTEAAGIALANGLALALGAATATLGYQHRNLLRVNLGLAFMALFLAFRFFDSEMSILARAGGFILVGIALIVINFLLSRRLRQEAAP